MVPWHSLDSSGLKWSPRFKIKVCIKPAHENCLCPKNSKLGRLATVYSEEERENIWDLVSINLLNMQYTLQEVSATSCMMACVTVWLCHSGLSRKIKSGEWAGSDASTLRWLPHLLQSHAAFGSWKSWPWQRFSRWDLKYSRTSFVHSWHPSPSVSQY